MGERDTKWEEMKGVVSWDIGLLGEPVGLKPVVIGSVQGVDVRVFLDTGASINLMNEEVFRSRFPDRILRPAQETVCDVQANKLRVLGCLDIDLPIGSRSLMEPFLVIRGCALGTALLLGHPSCRRRKISVHTGISGITVGVPGVFVPYEGGRRECGE